MQNKLLLLPRINKFIWSIKLAKGDRYQKWPEGISQIFSIKILQDSITNFNIYNDFVKIP